MKNVGLGVGTVNMVEDKVCVMCGVDVAKRPRVKDARGRYACKECATRYSAKLAATDLGDTAVEGTSFHESTEHFSKIVQSVCVKCKAEMPPGETTCPACGYNAAIGEVVENVAMKEWVERPLFNLSILEGFPLPDMSPGRQFIAWTVLFGGLFSLGTTNATTFHFYAGAVLLFLIVIYYKTIMMAFGEKRPGWGTCGAIGFVFLPLGLSMTIYGLFMTKNKPIRAAWGALLLALFGVGVLFYHYYGPKTDPNAVPAVVPAKSR